MAQIGTIDPDFNALVETATYSEKNIQDIIVLPTGKMMVTGRFNHYNGEPVGSLVRLNMDGSLDMSFDPNLFPVNSSIGLNSLPDGKIFVYDGNRVSLLSTNGDLDPSFNFQAVGTIRQRQVDASGRLILLGYFNVDRGGVIVPESVIRLNTDGSVDLTFDGPVYNDFWNNLTIAGNRVAIVRSVNAQYEMILLNENGSIYAQTNTTIGTNRHLLQINGLPNGKVLVLTTHRLYRLNEDGTIDPSFEQVEPFGPVNNPQKVRLGDDGRITIAFQRTAPYGMRVIRLLQDGSPDPSFVPYDYLDGIFQAYAVQHDGGVLIGDFMPSSPVSRFTRLLSSGSVDSTFNSGGSGFISVVPGKVRAIAVLPDGKLMIGGDFQRVNGVDRGKLARLNQDGTLDTSFQVMTGGAGSYFYEFREVYSITRQSDGKLIISGSLKYYINGIPKQLIVRINPDGSVDPTFNLAMYLVDYFGANSAGPARTIERPDGRLLVGQSSGNTAESLKVPLGLNSDGSIDQTFSSGNFAGLTSVAIDHIALMPDGKIVLSGRRWADEGYTGFVVRLSSDGSADQSFQLYERLNYRIADFEVLPDGKIVCAAKSLNNSRVLRLNSNGSIDDGFSSGIGANGVINSIALLADGKLLAGGLFSTFDTQSRQNLAILNSNGTLSPSVANTNGEVLYITQDAANKILIGGSFTRVGSSNEVSNRSHIARLTFASGEVNRVLFDYDGDGRSDLSVRRPSDDNWYVLRGTAGYMVMTFGVAGDLMVPADYDGDAKADIAMFRPSTGQWFIFNSQSQTFVNYSWGANGDLPVPADHDGDGKADLIVFRQSDGTWYRRLSNNTFSNVAFGVTGDKPVVGDFDGDGKYDIGLYRPSDHNWYILKTNFGFFVQTWGEGSDIPVPADYDSDGSTDVSVWRPSTGQWFRIQSTAGFGVLNWGQTGDMPIPADYDGDGKADVAVFRPSTGTWFAIGSTNGIIQQQFGQNGDLPTQSAFIY